MRELDEVKLKCDFQDLPAGTIGTVVLEYDDTAFEIEFVDNNGDTIGVLPTPAEKIELVTV